MVSAYGILISAKAKDGEAKSETEAEAEHVVRATPVPAESQETCDETDPIDMAVDGKVDGDAIGEIGGDAGAICVSAGRRAGRQAADHALRFAGSAARIVSTAESEAEVA